MATEKQLIKLERIKKVVDKTSNKDIPHTLAKGRIGYEKAIKSVMKAGEWATVVAVIAVGAAIVYMVLRWKATNGHLANYEIYLPIFTIVCSVICGVLGYKLWSLEGTPVFTLASLILILACNVLLLGGIFPLITVIYCIIALVRFGTFYNWFRKY